MANEYGLDVSYHKGKLQQIVRDIDRYTPDELARSLLRLVCVASPETMAESEFNKSENKAPWPDFEGNDLFEGDQIKHPISGESGYIIFIPEREHVSDQWVVDYEIGIESRLCLQVGDKGRAVKSI